MHRFSLGDIVRLPSGEEHLILGQFVGRDSVQERQILILGECTKLLSLAGASNFASILERVSDFDSKIIMQATAFSSGKTPFWPPHLLGTSQTGSITWSLVDLPSGQAVVVLDRSGETSVWALSGPRIPLAAIELHPAKTKTALKALPKIAASV